MVPQMCYVTAATTDEFRDAKPFTSIPGPVCFPLIGSLYTVPQLIKEKNANDASIGQNYSWRYTNTHTSIHALSMPLHTNKLRNISVQEVEAIAF